MSKFQGQVKTLVSLGLNPCEARVYLTLAQLGTCSAKMISKAIKVSKPDVYRVLIGLQERGIIEKALSVPAMFKAVPVELTTSIMLQHKVKELYLLKERTERLLFSFRNNQVEVVSPDEINQFVLIPAKKAELERRRMEIRSAQKSNDAVNTLKRFQRTLFVYADETINALRRGVKLRTITEKPPEGTRMPKFIKEFQKDESFRIRYVPHSLRAVFSIYDQKEALLTTSPSSGLGEAPTLWTKNPSLLTVLEDYFETLWAKALPIENQS